MLLHNKMYEFFKWFMLWNLLILHLFDNNLFFLPQEPKRAKITRPQENKSDKKANSDKSLTDSQSKSTVQIKDKQQQITITKKTSGQISTYGRSII